jgi:mercuric ion binding protein
MKLSHLALATLASYLALAPAVAGGQTVTLSVDNMSCITCGPIVKQSLLRVGGVTTVEVSLDTHTATVRFDDAKTNVAALVEATTNAGYPSRPAK